MKKLIIFLCIAIVAMSACNEAGSSLPVQQKQATKTAETPKPTPEAVEYLATSIALSELETELTKAPNCDGGECYSVKFTVGFKLAGNETHVFSHEFFERSFTYTVGEGKKDESVQKALQAQKTLSLIEPKNVAVTVTAGKVTKIKTLDQIDGKKLTPGEVLWEEK